MGIVFILSLVLMVFGLVAIIAVTVFHVKWLYTVYSAAAALLFMFYLAIDVQVRFWNLSKMSSRWCFLDCYGWPKVRSFSRRLHICGYSDLLGYCLYLLDDSFTFWLSVSHLVLEWADIKFWYEMMCIWIVTGVPNLIVRKLFLYFISLFSEIDGLTSAMYRDRLFILFST